MHAADCGGPVYTVRKETRQHRIYGIATLEALRRRALRRHNSRESGGYGLLEPRSWKNRTRRRRGGWAAVHRRAVSLPPPVCIEPTTALMPRAIRGRADRASGRMRIPQGRVIADTRHTSRLLCGWRPAPRPHAAATSRARWRRAPTTLAAAPPRALPTRVGCAARVGGNHTRRCSWGAQEVLISGGERLSYQEVLIS